MTREEEIDNAKTAFYERVLEDDYYYAPRDCFEEGAKWADSHPKSPWISIKDDLPNNPKYLKQPDYSSWVIALTENGEVIPAQMIVMHGKWIWHSRFSGKHENIIYWMFRPKFPPEFV